ncbi:MAG: hypothetical protein ACYCYE_18410 [Clostridia bacterium]
MSNLLTNYSLQDQQKMKDWMKQQGGAADMGMAISALGVKPITTVTPANNPVVNNTPAQNPAPLVTQKGTDQFVTAFTDREQQGFDSWYDMLAGKNGGSFLPGSVEDSIRGTYDKAGRNAYNSAIGNMTEFTGGRLNSWAAKAAADSKQDFAQQGSDAIANANLQYAQMVLNGMRDYTGAVSGRDDVGYVRDSTERQQGFNNNLAIGEATGYLPTSTMNVNNPWIVNGKAVDNVDYMAMYNAKKAINPNDPDLPLIMQARNLKIQSDPELMKKYGSTMTANVGYETLKGKETASNVEAKKATTEYNNALLAWQKDPKNSENIARLKNAQANLTSAGASASNAATNAAQLTWQKDPNNPDNIYKIAQANATGKDAQAPSNDVVILYSDFAQAPDKNKWLSEKAPYLTKEELEWIIKQYKTQYGESGGW